MTEKDETILEQLEGLKQRLDELTEDIREIKRDRMSSEVCSGFGVVLPGEVVNGRN